MKFNNKMSLLFAIVCCFIFIFTGCNKELIEVKENVQIENNDPVKVINYRRSNSGNSSKTINNKKGFIGTSIAVFSNETSYKNYIEDIEVQVEQWDDAFLAQWGHLNDDDLNAKEEELNYDSEKPLTDFENQIGLLSLRKQYLIAEEAWLNNDVLDPLTNPDNNPVYDFEEGEMAVLNTLAEVQIGTKIIKKLNLEEFQLVNETQGVSKSATGKGLLTVPYQDTYLIIDDSDYDALIDFNNGDTSVINNNNVTVTNNPPTTECKYAKELRKDFSVSSKKFFRAIVKVPRPSLGWNGKVKTKIKSFKKGVFGWRRWRTTIDVGARGVVFNGNCDNSGTSINKWRGAKKRKKRVFTWRNKSFSSHKVENAGMIGLYRYNDVVRELNLTW